MTSLNQGDNRRIELRTEAAPMAMHDFDFQIGKRVHLRGYGWRGLLALWSVLAAATVLAVLGQPGIAAALQWALAHVGIK